MKTQSADTLSNRNIILFGGSSDERKVSVASAQNIARSLPEALCWFVGTDLKVYPVTSEELLAHKEAFTAEFKPKASASYATLEKALTDPQWKKACFVLGFHGGEGEDGTVQTIFEKQKIAFTGSGAEASKKAFDKVWAKKIAKEAGITVCPEAYLNGKEGRAATATLKRMFGAHGDLIVKPVAGGSSIGVHFIKADKDIEEVVERLPPDDVSYLVETFIKGTEVTVGVIDDGKKVMALPPSEVRLLSPSNSFDYDGKYLGKGVKEITPAEISAELTAHAQKIALQAHEALGCEGYSRTDLILSAKGPVYLETNTLPGLTKASFIPQQLEVAKISFSDFIHTQIQIARKRNG